MADYTKNYHLKKPLPEEFYDVADQNGNMDLIDAQMKRNAEDIQKIMEKGAGGIPPQIIVTSKNGSTVTCTKDETTLEQISSGTVTFDLDSYGTWHVTATSDGVPIETDVLVDDVKQYFITLDKAVATIEVKTSNGAAVKATNGYIVLTGSGSTMLSIPQNGEWGSDSNFGRCDSTGYCKCHRKQKICCRPAYAAIHRNYNATRQNRIPDYGNI